MAEKALARRMRECASISQEDSPAVARIGWIDRQEAGNTTDFSFRTFQRQQTTKRRKRFFCRICAALQPYSSSLSGKSSPWSSSSRALDSRVRFSTSWPSFRFTRSASLRQGLCRTLKSARDSADETCRLFEIAPQGLHDRQGGDSGGFGTQGAGTEMDRGHAGIFKCFDLTFVEAAFGSSDNGDLGRRR